MSTTPRVQSGVPGEPAIFKTVLAHQPEVFEAFWKLYGTFWSHGVVDHATKETARMRNARKTDCGYCKMVRFSAARAEGLDEDVVSLIEDGYDDAPLTARQKIVLHWTDAFLDGPGSASPELVAAANAEFSPAELAELTLGISLFMGFAKVLISMGLEPTEMDTTVVPTPDFVAA
jgi:alkylhydroperoxidase family enzyme